MYIWYINDTHTQNRRESKLNTEDSHQITREVNRRRNEQKRPTKTTINKMAVTAHISITTLNVNGLTAQVKRHRVAERIQKQNHMYAAYKRLTSDLKTHADWKWGDGKRYSMQMEIKRKLA